MLSRHSLPRVIKVKADQCAFGLTTKVGGKERLVKKPAGLLTNSWRVARELDRKCDQSHSHFSLMEGRATQALQCFRAAVEFPRHRRHKDTTEPRYRVVASVARCIACWVVSYFSGMGCDTSWVMWRASPRAADERAFQFPAALARATGCARHGCHRAPKCTMTTHAD